MGTRKTERHTQSEREGNQRDTRIHRGKRREEEKNEKRKDVGYGAKNKRRHEKEKWKGGKRNLKKRRG